MRSDCNHTCFSFAVLSHGVGIALRARLGAAAHRVSGLVVQSAKLNVNNIQLKCEQQFSVKQSMRSNLCRISFTNAE